MESMMEIDPGTQSKVLESIMLHMRKMQLQPSHRPTIKKQWGKLADAFTSMGLSKNTTNALISWVDMQTTQCRTVIPKIRLLHPMEKEFISMDAYSYILELHFLGLLNHEQLEHVIEGCAGMSSLPVQVEQVQKLVLQIFSEQWSFPGLGQAN